MPRINFNLPPLAVFRDYKNKTLKQFLFYNIYIFEMDDDFLFLTQLHHNNQQSKFTKTNVDTKICNKI